MKWFRLHHPRGRHAALERVYQQDLDDNTPEDCAPEDPDADADEDDRELEARHAIAMQQWGNRTAGSYFRST